MESQGFAHRPRRRWTQVAIEVPAVMAEAVADHLAGLTGAGVETVTAGGAAPGEAGRETVIAYLPGEERGAEAGLREFLARLGGAFPDEGAVEVRTAVIEEEDWAAGWKRHFHPFHASPRLVIRPSWEPYAAAAGEAVLEMDPGLAFGTGHHESTRLALALIEERFGAGPPPARVLDVGTGTGVLGMACALWGAGEVLGLDHDPDAVEAARANVRRNGLERRVRVSGDDLEGVAGPFDLIAANITADVLGALAPGLAARLAPGGLLVLSGILAGEQEAQVRARFEALGLGLGSRRAAGEWVALALALPPPAEAV